MANDLKKTYFALLIPAISGFILIIVAKTFHFIVLEPVQFLPILAPIVFIMSVVFAVALPIFFRTIFAHKIRHQKNLSEADWIKFERHFLYIVLVTPYLMLMAYLFEFPRFYLSGTVLMTLYATYFYYPSNKRIAFERRIFRVE